jgi:tetratricopeptide (TPR) repeat protein
MDHAEVYAACMALVEEDAEEAFETALAWEAMGGGEAARHCAAVALIGLGQFAEAAGRLETLAETVGGGRPDLQVSALGQAGQAWLLADDTERAYAVQTTALGLEPDNVELLIDRSMTLARATNYQSAVDDLNRAARIAPDRPDILILRASVLRYIDAPSTALADVERALVLDPDNPDGLLERGNLRRLVGDPDGARADWLRVLELAADTSAAEAARANLEKLDVEVE